ncbi:MAG: ABC transporter ATP-binding protein [Bacteroidota bacterium]|nr:ABC transporter ATP-binding protein [Bacteroidota bacterium]MDP4212120.1 ABC transporter ATP-binding protein [Bacteroidota bacterium]MDP4249486.1 ABC transporter ATP-binding protein [Bacteroidota bacterium]
MNNLMIRAEDVSKYYRLGVLSSGTLKEDIKNWWSGKWRQQTPAVTQHKNHIWALRNIHFEVNKGDVLGLIGKNGSGKSTLLKIISRITLPTGGRVRGNGRIASLLEVGTGFHSELTGRENIYLNGHIMGMKKKEIDRKFDEIVDFSGVERFLDTPVKRYSSGMYVRLAFAVAANLDPEILIIDEVLAVGDSEFQKKCLGKMKSVSGQEGKTILFVSHNMHALRNLCNRALLLEKGQIVASGDPEQVISQYLKSGEEQFLGNDYSLKPAMPGNEYIRVQKVELVPEYIQEHPFIDIRTPLRIKFEFWYDVEEPGDLMAGIHLFNFTGEFIFDLTSGRKTFQKGLLRGECLIPGNFLNDGSYYISIVFIRNATIRLFYLESCLSFDVEDYRENGSWYGKWPGIVRPDFPVTLSALSGA